MLGIEEKKEITHNKFIKKHFFPIYSRKEITMMTTIAVILVVWFFPVHWVTRAYKHTLELRVTKHENLLKSLLRAHDPDGTKADPKNSALAYQTKCVLNDKHSNNRVYLKQLKSAIADFNRFKKEGFI